MGIRHLSCVARDQVRQSIPAPHILLRLLLGRRRLLGSLGDGVPAAAEALTEGGQLAGLVDLDILQALLVGLPERVVPRVLGALVHAERRRRPHRVGAAVRELHQLRERVRPARPLDECCGAARRARERRVRGYVLCCCAV